MACGRLGLILVFSLLLVCLCGGQDHRPILGAVWRTWKDINNKKYPSLREERLRMRIFKSNYLFSQYHNVRYHLGLESYYTALNKFADLTIKEFEQQYLTLRKMDKRNYFWGGNEPRHFSSRIQVPESVDWRKKGFVTPVKDQGQCGSCWAFSATGSLEGQIKKKTGELISISEQQLVDCSQAQGNEGCNGGLMDNAFEYWEQFGAENETSYRYTAKDGRCKYNRKLVVANLTGYKDVLCGSEAQLQASVANVGPISVAIDASGVGFQMYSGGVYVNEDCSPDDLDHGVLAVGYDVDKNGREYWIVKNSWGPDWGNQGYIWMARNKKNMCGIATAASYPIV